MSNERTLLQNIDLVESRLVLEPKAIKQSSCHISKRAYSYLHKGGECDRILAQLPEHFRYEPRDRWQSGHKRRQRVTTQLPCKRDQHPSFQKILPAHLSFVNQSPDQLRSLFEMLQTPQLQFLNDYHRRGKGNLYNVFEEEENIKERLEKCPCCSTNMDTHLKSEICVDTQCAGKRQFACPACLKDPKNPHFNHRTVPLFNILYYYQKDSNLPRSKSQIETLAKLLSQVQSNLCQIQLQQKRLQYIQLTCRSILAVVQPSSHAFDDTRRSLSGLISSLPDLTPDQFQSRMSQILLPQSAISYNDSFPQFPKLQIFTSTAALVDTYQRPFTPSLPCSPAIIEAVNVFIPIAEPITLLTSMPLVIKDVSQLKLVCDGQTRLRVGKVREAKIGFKGRVMDREIKTSIEALRKWSFSKNKFRGFEFEMDYKLNCHPTTENNPLLTELLKVFCPNVRVSLSGVKRNEMLVRQLNSALTAFREMKQLSLSISMNHIHAHNLVSLDQPSNLIDFVQSLGLNLQRLYLKLPIAVPERVLVQVCEVLLTKKCLTEVKIQLDQPLPSLYSKLAKVARRRKMAIYKLIWAKRKTQCGNQLSKEFYSFIT